MKRLPRSGKPLAAKARGSHEVRRRLKFQSFAPGGEAYHAGVSLMGPGVMVMPHTHDFHEVFWIPHGSGVHEWNGESQPLGTGSLAFIRPRDIHALLTQDEELGIRNIAFEPATAALLEKSLRERGGGSAVFPGGRLSAQIHISSALLADLNASFDRLMVTPRQILPLYAFLFDLVERLVFDAPKSGSAASVPGWLAQAVEGLRMPGAPGAGLPEFYRACGRCHDQGGLQGHPQPLPPGRPAHPA